MRRSFVAIALIALAVFGIGYIVGQVRGVAPSAAATGRAVNAAPNSFDANAVTHPFAAGSMAKHADGTVTAVNGDTITVQADNDASNPNEYPSVTTIQLTGSTQYNVTGGKSAIKVGSHIVAEGTVSADGKTLTASQVSTGGPGGCQHGTSSGTTTPGASTSSINA